MQKTVLFLLAWAILMVTVEAFLFRETSPDAYANEPGFTLIVFLLFRFPLWLSALGIGLLCLKRPSEANRGK